MQERDNCGSKPHERLRGNGIEVDMLAFDGSRKYFLPSIKKAI